MRMEEIGNGRYIKGTDSVERYLLDVIKKYFENANIPDVSSREYIIQRAVRRMKDEMDLEDIGVLSITLPNGQVKKGAVILTLDDFNGEPAITNKRTAFNVNFGNTKGTACEGNDPRLSDARDPLPHTHTISEINGLQGVLSSMQGRVNSVTGLMHDHTNKQILDKLMYTGHRTSIDLTILDTYEEDFASAIQAINNDVDTYRASIPAAVNNVNTIVANIENTIAQIRQQNQAHNDVNLGPIKLYVDDQIRELDQSYYGISLGISKQLLDDSLKENIKFLGSFDTPLIDIFDDGYRENMIYSVPFDNNILRNISNRDRLMPDIKCEIFLVFENNGITSYQPVPYIIVDDNNQLRGTFYASLGIQGSGNNVAYSINCSISPFSLNFMQSASYSPEQLMNAKLRVKVYTQPDIEVVI